jgi:hypothetical protein
MGRKNNFMALPIWLLLGLIMVGGLTQYNQLSVQAANEKITSYTVNYDVQADWGTGAVVNVTIKNTAATAINGWDLTWTFPGNQKITAIWNAICFQNNTGVTVKNHAYNKWIAAGASQNFGFVIIYSGTNNKPVSFTLNGATISTATAATATPTPTATTQATATPTTTMSATATATATTTNSNYKNPDDYINQTTVTVLNASVVDIYKRTAEFQGLVKSCTKVAYAYADPEENATAYRNTNKEGASSFAAYIFGYDSTTTTEFLNAKKYVPYILNKLYYDSKLRSTWYQTLATKNDGVYIILEKAANMDGCRGVKFGNINDGFGMRLGAGCMSVDYGRHVLFHEMSHCIWDSSATTNDFYVGVDPRTNINYGTGTLITLFNKLYENSIRSNTFYSGTYGWNYSHENFAESAAKFLTKDFRTKLLKNDPVVYNIMSQIYTEFNF